MLKGSERRVAIVQRRLVNYRVPLFEAMRERLASRGIVLRLLHGEPTPADAQRHDSGQLAWAEKLPTSTLAGGRLVWQPYSSRVADCALVIVPQENRLLHNLVALADPRRHAALAFFGHGRNLQADGRHAAREWFKRQTTRRADWWFAYTRSSADIVAAAGFRRECITVVDNSIDTTALSAAIQHARALPAAERRLALGLRTSGPLVVFIGSLYADKRIDRLLELAAELHHQDPALQLAIGGDGPERERLRQALQQAPWRDFVQWLGNVEGERKAALLASADLLLSPGVVGLGVLDAFAAGVPLVTTQGLGHGPELDYVEHGRNALVVADGDLTATVRQLLADPAERARLAAGAHEAGLRYTIEGMSERFCAGIEACLAAHAAGHPTAP